MEGLEAKANETPHAAEPRRRSRRRHGGLDSRLKRRKLRNLVLMVLVHVVFVLFLLLVWRFLVGMSADPT